MHAAYYRLPHNRKRSVQVHKGSKKTRLNPNVSTPASGPTLISMTVGSLTWITYTHVTGVLSTIQRHVMLSSYNILSQLALLLSQIHSRTRLLSKVSTGIFARASERERERERDRATLSLGERESASEREREEQSNVLWAGPR